MAIRNKKVRPENIAQHRKTKKIEINSDKNVKYKC